MRIHKFTKPAALVLSAVLLFGASSDSKAAWDPTITCDRSADGSTTYTNRITGRSYTEYADGTGIGDPGYEGVPLSKYKKLTVQKGSLIEIRVDAPYNQLLRNLKVTKGKKNAAVKIGYSIENTITHPDTFQDEQGRIYMTDPRTGERIYVDNPRPKVTESFYVIWIYGKKTGKSTISYQFTDNDGNVISTEKINVNVVAEDSKYKSITYAGKSLQLDQRNNRNYIGAGEGTNRIPYQTKKKGKLKVVMSKGYKLKAIYVKKPTKYVDTPYKESTGRTGHHAVRSTRAVDLNGDGDYIDTVYGIDESLTSEYSYKKIKNGATLKLSTVPDSYTDDHYVMTQGNGIPDFRYDKNTRSNISTTDLIIVYLDKFTGRYETDTWSICLKSSK